MSLALAFLAGVAAAAGVFLFLDHRRSLRMGRFFSHAAHEISTPITAINITTLNFLSGVFGEVPPEQLKWMDMMREQVGRLNGMVGELRDLIHIALSRDLRLQVDNAAPAALVEDAVAAVRRGASQPHVEVRVELPADLPRVRVDRERTVRTLLSLIFHARKFRVSGDLRLVGQRSEETVALTLEYQGQALAPDEVQRSLELFYPGRGHQGHVLNAVGLGLGVLRTLARHQGGDLDFSVAPDGKSAMTLSLEVSPFGKAVSADGGAAST